MKQLLFLLFKDDYMFLLKFICVKIPILFLAFSSLEALAYCTQTKNDLIGLVGSDTGSGNTVYAGFSSETNQCDCKFARFHEEAADTNKALSILMAAKLSRSTVRIDYLEANNCNSAWRVYLE